MTKENNLLCFGEVKQTTRIPIVIDMPVNNTTAKPIMPTGKLS